MKRWKVGLVGTGYWSENHLDAWQRIDNVDIEAICDHSHEKLVLKGKQYGISKDRQYQDVREMLDKTDIDVVDIVTGLETHMQLVSLAAKAGKHVMCQKPFAPSLKEAETMVQEAQNAGVRLMVTENWRWYSPFQTIKSILNRGILGRPQVARYHHKAYYTPRMAPEVLLPQPFFREMPKLLFYEMGAHWFDTWRFLFGTPKRLTAEILNISPYVSGEDSGIVLLGYEDFHGMLDMSWATRDKLDNPLSKEITAGFVEKMTIDGEHATLKLYATSKTKRGKITITDSMGYEQLIESDTVFNAKESHFRLQTHFIDSLEQGKDFQTSGEDNLNTLKMLFATYESASKQQTVLVHGGGNYE